MKVKEMLDLITKGYITVTEKVRDFQNSERAVTSVEYAIVVAGVAAVVMVVFGTKGPVATMLNSVFSTVQTKVIAMVQ